MNLRFEVIWVHFPAFVNGLGNTICICAVGSALSLVFGVALLLPMLSSQPLISRLTQALVDGTRAIPFLMLAYLVYYGLPTVGVTLSSWMTAILTVFLYNTAYIAEILRSAWTNLPPGQIEAARAYGFTGIQLLQKITLPQMLIATAPMLGNQLIQVIKDSAFLAIITMPELTYVATTIQATYYVPFETFVTAALLYWGLCLVIESGVRRVESLKNQYVKY